MQDIVADGQLGESDHRSDSLLATNWTVAAIAACAAVAAGFSPAAPTTLGVWDFFLKLVLGLLFVAAIVRSPRWFVVVVAAIAGIFLGTTAWVIAAGVALALAFGSSLVRDESQATLVAVSGGLTLQGLLRLPPVGFFGLPSLVAGLCIGLVFVFGYIALGDDGRRITSRVIGVGIVVVAAISIVGAVVLLGARADVERGIDAARGSLSAARGGDPEAVVDELETAANALGAAEDQASRMLAQPLRLLPVAAQHRHAVVVATNRGSEVAQQASRATVEADISSVTMSTGSVDLSALTAMEPDLAETVSLLEAGVSDLDDALSPWLLPPIASRMESLTDELRIVLPEARVAADAARVLPGMLGAQGPRRYFVAFGSPAESREFGGFMGSWALLELDDGTIRRIEAGRTRSLYDLTRLNGPLNEDDYPPWYVKGSRPSEWPQNIGASPQLSVVAEAAREIFDGLGGGSIDGFVYIDGYALGAMLDITGPVNVVGVDQPISADNANDFFFDGQYRLDERDQFKADLTEIFAVAFDDLIDSALPGPERLGRILGPAARQGRLQIATFDEDENAFLRSVKLQRDFARSFDTEDAFALVQTNVVANKLDLFLHREVSYDVTVDADGRLFGDLAVNLDFDLPLDPPEYSLGTNEPGVYRQHLSLYSRHAVASAHLDGEPVEVRATTEFGIRRYEITVEFTSASSRVVEFELVGLVDPDNRYAVSVWQQPLVNNDDVTVTYRKQDKSLETQHVELVENVVFAFDD